MGHQGLEILQIQIWDYFMIGVKCHSHVDLHPNFIKFESILLDKGKGQSHKTIARHPWRLYHLFLSLPLNLFVSDSGGD